MSKPKKIETIPEKKLTFFQYVLRYYANNDYFVLKAKLHRNDKVKKTKSDWDKLNLRGE